MIESIEAANECIPAPTVNGTSLANNVILSAPGGALGNFTFANISRTFAGTTNIYNLTMITYNFTRVNGTLTNFSNNSLLGYVVGNTTSMNINVGGLNETRFNLTVSVYNSTGTAANTTFCESTYTGVVIDIFNIATPTIDAGPLADLRVTNKTKLDFNISAGRDGESIDNAVLYLGSNIHNLLRENVLATRWSVALTDKQIPTGTYNWYIRSTDTDGTTTSDTAVRKLIYDSQTGGVNQQAVDEALKQQGKGTTTGTTDNTVMIVFGLFMIVILGYWFIKKGK